MCVRGRPGAFGTASISLIPGFVDDWLTKIPKKTRKPIDIQRVCGFFVWCHRRPNGCKLGIL
nr:MAG TPA: hypothetical protein [Caudoviricetes sp.]